MGTESINLEQVKTLLEEAKRGGQAVSGMFHLIEESLRASGSYEELSGYLAVIEENLARIASSHLEIGRVISGTNEGILKSSADGSVLLVDDDPVQHLFVQRALEGVSDVVVARNGKVGFDMFLETPFKLILMDCQMPVLDGFQLTTAIRKYEIKTGQPRTPIIAYTAHGVAGYKQRCLEVGMDEYVKKPITSAELKKVVQKFVSVEKSVEQ